MDWINWHFVAGMWAGAASATLGGLMTLGWLSALRRRSEPRPFVHEQASPRNPLAYDPKCPDCNPPRPVYCKAKPPSAQTSPSATETPEATQNGS